MVTPISDAADNFPHVDLLSIIEQEIAAHMEAILVQLFCGKNVQHDILWSRAQSSSSSHKSNLTFIEKNPHHQLGKDLRAG